MKEQSSRASSALPSSRRPLALPLALVLGLVPLSAFAGESTAKATTTTTETTSTGFTFAPFSTPSEQETEWFDNIWDAATLYSNDDNAFIQQFKLRGRYQGQYHWLDSDQGNDNGWEDRRSRFGFDATLFKKTIEARLDFQSNDGFEDVYDSLVDAYIKWKPSKNFSLTVGRTKPQIAYYDFLQSTNNQPTFERSQIFNQLGVDRATSVIAEGKVGNFTWQTGAYSNDIDSEFGQFNGGYSFGGGIGYDFKESLGWKRADFRVDYLHSDHDAADTVLTRYDDLVSVTAWGQQGRWGGVVEGFGGFGANAGDVFGFFVQPTYDLISKRLQLVARYSFATGDGEDSLRRQSRYEAAAPNLTGGGQGDRYHAIYLGTQYFIHGDKLKLLAGVEYADLDGGGNGGDYSGLTWLAGVRFSF